MLSALAAAIIGIWFYLSAPRSQRPAVSWAISGVIIYFFAAMLWTLLITPSIKDTALHSQNSVLIFIVRYAYILFGIACCALANHFLNKPATLK
jgi:hypothetical protein